MNYEKHIFILFILKNYFMKNFGCHYPTELVVMIMKCYYRDEWIDTQFDNFPRFDHVSYANILNLGAGIDQIIFKFILPKLPEEFTYKKICVHDLISTIRLCIDGCDILYLKCLQFFDCIKYDNDNTRIISYRLVLGHFFGESVPSKFYHHLPRNFKGIRLNDCKNSNITLFMRLHKIHRIIDVIDKEINVDKNPSLSKLELKNVIVSCHYVEVYQKNPYLVMHNETHIIQKIRSWNTFIVITHSTKNHYEFRLNDLPSQTSKIIFHSKQLYKIKGFILQLNDKDFD